MLRTSRLMTLAISATAAAQSFLLPPKLSRDDVSDVVALERRLGVIRTSVSWAGKPLHEIVRDLRILTGATILMSPALEPRRDETLSLELKDVSTASLLRITAKSARVVFLWEDGILRMTTPEDADKRRLTLHVYDVSDLLYRAPDFPAPDLGLHPGKPGTQPAEENPGPADRADLVDLIRRLMGEDVWSVEGASITLTGRLLVVKHSPERQREVQRLLDLLSAL